MARNVRPYLLELGPRMRKVARRLVTEGDTEGGELTPKDINDIRKDLTTDHGDLINKTPDEHIEDYINEHASILSHFEDMPHAASQFWFDRQSELKNKGPQSYLNMFDMGDLRPKEIQELHNITGLAPQAEMSYLRGRDFGLRYPDHFHYPGLARAQQYQPKYAPPEMLDAMKNNEMGGDDLFNAWSSYIDKIYGR